MTNIQNWTLAASAALALILAGCGGTAAPSTAQKQASADLTHAASRRDTAQALLLTQGAHQFARAGHPTITAAACHGASLYACQITYQFTAPNGIRRVLRMTVPVRCDATGCAAQWADGSTGHVIRTLGLDPRSPVARCQAATLAAANHLTNPAYTAVARDTCRGVHHGVYTGN